MTVKLYWGGGREAGLPSEDCQPFAEKLATAVNYMYLWSRALPALVTCELTTSLLTVPLIYSR